MVETPEQGSDAARPPAGAAVPSKRARILQRTLFGTGIALLCAGALWLTHSIGSATPVLCVGVLIALLGLIEASMMGTLLMRGLPVMLLVPLFGITMLEFAGIGRPLTTAPWVQLSVEIVFAALLVVVTHAINRGLSRHALARQTLITILCGAIAGGFSWLKASNLGPLDVLPAFGVLGAAALLIAVLANRTASRRKDLCIAIGLALWIAVPLPALTQVERLWGVTGLVSLIVLSKIGDVAGYYVGNAIGRTHPFPKLSPGKTVAGCVASLLAGVAAGAVLAYFELLPSGSWGIVDGLIAGAFINLASQSGDLFESWVKRRVRVKDSSTWLGPSGGVLDVVDSLLFSVPVTLVIWPLIFDA